MVELLVWAEQEEGALVEVGQEILLLGQVA
jgi:hypothetical protein